MFAQNKCVLNKKKRPKIGRFSFLVSEYDL